MEKFGNDNGGSDKDHNGYHEDLLRHRKASKYGYHPGSKEESDFLDWERRFDKKEQQMKEYENSLNEGLQNNETQEVPDSVERIQEIVSIINDVRLQDGVSDREQQQVLLDGKKEQAKNLIRDLIQDDLANYVSTVRQYDRARADLRGDDIEAEEFAEYNERRTRSHDVLIDRVNVVVRFIRNNFGLMSEEELDTYEESLEQRGESFLEVERVKLPDNVICPDYINLAVREEITDWALDISRSLADIKFN